ncbi:protein EXORDIUM-like protein 7 [Cinnamomum micranthum f. kanehirae]|uniref:Protein EXORDIUM-like protein 7 n=1 Tax=Cinnamomum micranthum f. kanehirae TaxID=337451 RepID=A0A3S3ML70_9MAGN|nr:protein EXORDIUM-like protein 7 [Cinnamomum micranthum f. kanehirae]
MGHLHFLLHFLLSLSCFSCTVLSWNSQQLYRSNNYEGSSDLVNLVYHMGPVLASPINLYTIWYGNWNPAHQAIIRDFLISLSSSPSSSSFPSVADWWRTVRLYTDQTGSNITGNVILSGEHYDTSYSHGRYLTRLAIQSIIKTAAVAYPRPLPLNSYNGVYLVLTSSDVMVAEFCRAVCGFHYFTFPAIVGATVPYAWVGYSGTQCPGMCAYPFALPKYENGAVWTRSGNRRKVMGAPNGDVGADGMVSVIAHELAEMASNPLINAWYAGDDPMSPTEIADLCVGVYGSGGGGGYAGMVYKDRQGRVYNVHGVKGRRFLLQWVWSPVRKRCFGPNALD